MNRKHQKFVALSGGVGGAKLVLGLANVLLPEQLQVVANTGDDFDHLGLRICPDIDTLIYTLAELANPETGWGRNHESWDYMDALAALGGETWFQLGDRDLEMHIRRHELLTAGLTLSETTRRLATESGVSIAIHPMSDQPAATRIATADTELSFQDYFVRQRAQPVATAVHCAGENVAPGKGALEGLTDANLTGIIICPSNPWLSVAPILSVTGLRSSILKNKAPVTAVSPIVAGKAIKGPTAKLMNELGISTGVTGIAEYYRDIVDGLVIDQQDAHCKAAIEGMGIQVAVTDTIMNDLADKKRLARFVIDFSLTLGETD